MKGAGREEECHRQREIVLHGERGRSPMSLIKIKPRIDPWGTIEDTGREEEREFPTLTEWEREHK